MTSARAMPTITETRKPKSISPAVTAVARMSVPHCAASACAIFVGAGITKEDIEKMRTAAFHNAIVTRKRIPAGSQCFVAALHVESGCGDDETFRATSVICCSLTTNLPADDWSAGVPEA